MNTEGLVSALSAATGSMPDVSTGHTPKADETAIANAHQALVKADSAVDQDKRNHSPDCVAVDQKAVNQAATDLAHAQAQARADGVLDITT